MKKLLFISLLGYALWGCNSDRNLQTYLPVRKALENQIEKNHTGVLNLLAEFEATDLKNYTERALPVWKRASRIRMLNLQCDSIITGTQHAIVDKAGGVDEQTGIANGYADVGIASRYMSDGKFGDHFVDFINERIKSINENMHESGGYLDIIDPPYIEKKWAETEMGNKVPVTIALTKLSLLQLAISDYTLSILQHMLQYSQRHVGCVMDRVEAAVSTNTSMVVAGTTYEAYIYYSVNNVPINLEKAGARVYVNDKQIPFDGATGIYRVTNTKPGTYRWKGYIEIKGVDGTQRQYATADQVYTVYDPAAIQLLDDERIMYTGTDNKFSVFAPGVPPSQLKVTITNGKIINTDGIYTARIDNPGKTTITVTIRLNKGGSVELCKTEYTVRSLSAK